MEHFLSLQSIDARLDSTETFVFPAVGGRGHVLRRRRRSDKGSFTSVNADKVIDAI